MKLDIVESASVILMRHTASCHSFVCSLKDGSVPKFNNKSHSSFSRRQRFDFVVATSSKANLKSLVFAT